MSLSRLLGTRFECGCGRTHHVPIRELVYERDAVDSLPEILQRSLDQARIERVVVVADMRTWEVCGDKVSEAMTAAEFKVSRIIVPDRGPRGPVCDDATCRWLIEQVHPLHPDLVAAVGSGVINDLCKWASFELKTRYIVVATAASMNGYSSANVAPTIAGLKVLFEARPPAAVIAEPDIIEGAPARMTTAGFGDVIAKHQSNGDWVINHMLLGEYYCPFCAKLVVDIEPLYLDHPEDIRDGKPRAVRGLFEALFWTGMAMTLVGTSAPASGGEHLLSHTLDMVAEMRGESHDLHGRQVGIGTLLSAALFERVLAIESPVLADLPAQVDASFWTAPSIASAVREQYEAKRQRLDVLRQGIGRHATWDELRRRVAAEVKSPRTIHGWLRRSGGAVSPADIGCSRERLRSAILHMHEIRKRFTIIDLAWLLGIVPSAVDEILDEWLAP